MSSLARRITALLLFALCFALYIATAYPTVSAWKAAETAVTVSATGISASPGAPLYLLLARAAAVLVPVGDLAFRLSMLSAALAAATVATVYFLASSICRQLLDRPGAPSVPVWAADAAGVLGATALAASDSFWRHATTAEPMMPAVLLLAVLLLSGVRIHLSKSPRERRRWHTFTAYGAGLLSGAQPVFLLVIPALFFLIPDPMQPDARRRLLRTGAGTVLCVIAFPVLGWVFPNAIAARTGELPAAAVAAGTHGALVIAAVIIPWIAWRRYAVRGTLSFARMSLFFLVGSSTGLVLAVRGSQQPSINTGGVGTYGAYASYLGTQFASIAEGESVPGGNGWADVGVTEQTTSLVSAFAGSFRKRFTRYLGWNLVGRAGDSFGASWHAMGAAFPDGDDAAGEGAQVFPRTYWAVPLALALLGCVYAIHASAAIGGYLFLAFLLPGIGGFLLAPAGNGAGMETDAWMLPSLLVAAVWMAAGIVALTGFLARREVAVGAQIAVLLALFALIPGNFVRAGWKDHDHHGDFTTRDAAYNMLQSCDEHAILFTSGDNDTFPLLYLQDALGVRRDVAVVNLGLLSKDWYTLQVTGFDRPASSAVPTLFTPDDIRGLARLDTTTAARFGWITPRMEIRLPVPQRVARRFRLEHMRSALRVVDSARWRTLPGELVASQEAPYAIAADGTGEIVRYCRPLSAVMIEDILRANDWRRPVYFSVMCPGDLLDGYEEYCRYEGLARRLTPYPSPGGEEVLHSALATDLLHRVPGPSTGPRRGFLLSNVNLPGQYDDESARGSLRNIRNLFLRLAEYELHHRGDARACVRTLNAMERAVPRAHHPMDYREIYDIALLYRAAGASAKHRALFREITGACMRDIAERPWDGESIYTPYRYLLEIYEMERQYDRALAVLTLMEHRYPHAPEIAEKRRALREARQLQR